MFSILTTSLLVALVLLNLILIFRTRRVEVPPPVNTEPLDAERHAAILRSQEALEHRLREELGRTQIRNAEDSRALRRELMEALELNRTATEASLEKIRGLVDARLFALQQGNEKKLDEMRQTVDEKLQGTLEARLGASFKLVSERLEQVQRGLGEMQTLASGVGDLKRVLSNVTTRGAWGEVQLENILQQILAPEQFERNVSPKGNTERVEFAIRLPGSGKGDDVWLPIDAKFPMEAYQRLSLAAEKGDAAAVEDAARELETAVKGCAKTFASKYLAPPKTTDFGIIFLATEGLYAETLRRPGLTETLQRDFRVILAGPTTFAAILNSLQMGFKTLAIQERSSEVWKVLGEVKSQFQQYGGVLAKVKKKIEEAGNTIDEAERRNRVIEKKLRGVETPEVLADVHEMPRLFAAGGD